MFISGLNQTTPRFTWGKEAVIVGNVTAAIIAIYIFSEYMKNTRGVIQE